MFRHMAYQLAVAATLNFLRTCMSYPPKLVRSLILTQLAFGAALLVWGNLIPLASAWTVDVWRIINVLGFTAVFLTLTHALLSDSRHPPWMALGACLMGFGLGLSDMAAVDRLSIPVSPMHSVFSAYLLMVWLLLSNRLGRYFVVPIEGGTRSDNSILGGEFAHTDLIEEFTEAGHVQGASEVGMVQRRIAQDLHDGVGSQLVSILASLDRKVPQQQHMALALEECLLDVKMLSDGIDGEPECVLDALARLRYRVQPSLDRLGIALNWDLNACPVLEGLRDERVRQVLRIAQEALANVMRHSHAKSVEVGCVYMPEVEALLLAISDDGVGIEASKRAGRSGKGLKGMRRRAESIGADLEISSPLGRGASIRLVVPLSPGLGPGLRENERAEGFLRGVETDSTKAPLSH
jgi:signal transduction histidine kinase